MNDPIHPTPQTEGAIGNTCLIKLDMSDWKSIISCHQMNVTEFSNSPRMRKVRTPAFTLLSTFFLFGYNEGDHGRSVLKHGA